MKRLLPKAIQIRIRKGLIVDIIWGDRLADCFCLRHLRHWKEGSSTNDICRKCLGLDWIGEVITMPVHKGKDSRGTYYQWGSHGKKYRGKGARSKAARQGMAAYAHGYRE